MSDKEDSEPSQPQQPPSATQQLFSELYQIVTKQCESKNIQLIQNLLNYRQARTYNVMVNDKEEYFCDMWQHMKKQLYIQSERLKDDMIEAIKNRFSHVIQDIEEQKIIVQHHRLKPYDYEEELKEKKLSMLRNQSEQIHKKLLDMHEGINDMHQNRATTSRVKGFQIKQEKLKEYEEFLKKQKKEKEERAKIIEEQKKKEGEILAKREEEQKEQKDKLFKEKKEELLKKLKENEERRSKEKLQREQRNKQYRYISKSFAQQPPLFKRLEANYHHRYQISENQKRKQVISERQSLLDPIDSRAIEDHERKYEQIRAEKERLRRQRMQQMQKMLEIQQEELQSKYNSTYELKSNYVDPKDEERKAGLEKKQKMKKYIEETVKERYLPKIDQEKRKEFIQMMEDMHKKKVKKVKHEDGTYEYEQIKPSDPRMVGLEYLEKTKQMAAKMRGRRKNSEQMETNEQKKPKVFDYLAEQRKKGTSMSHRNSMGWVGKKGLSFDEKLKKVQLQSQKLQEMAKQKQMKLKFGKFATSDQILHHKQEIDQHYIDIINMKLKLINFKDNKESQSEQPL